jgi:hypothetical protein
MFVSLELLAKKRRELDALEAEWLREVAAFDRSGDWRVDGYLNSAVAIRTACRMNEGVARGYVELARKLETLPVVAGAYGNGEISQRHAAVIAGACTPKRARAIANVEAELVEVARSYAPRTLSGFVRHLTDAIDGDGGAATDQALYERRALYLAPTLDGSYDIRGTCDQITGLALQTALDAEMQRDLRPHDPRLTPQRRMDALSNLARHSLDRGELGEAHGIRPHINVVIDLDELPGHTSGLKTRIRADLRRDHPLSATTLEWLSCDCDISRVITAGQSEIRDVGRATRTIPPAIWKALVARDHHCQAPACDQPPERCEGHHVIHWERGGPTSLENLQLLCRHHHRQTHNHDAQARAA